MDLVWEEWQLCELSTFDLYEHVVAVDFIPSRNNYQSTWAGNFDGTVRVIDYDPATELLLDLYILREWAGRRSTDSSVN